MPPTFSFEVDQARNLVKVTMSGFFQPADVARFATARDEAHRLLRCAPNQHFTLVDIRGMQIQAKDSVEQFAMLLSRKEYASKRIAFVVTQSLARLQIQRAAAGRGAGYFSDDPVAAEAWLFDKLVDGRAA